MLTGKVDLDIRKLCKKTYMLIYHCNSHGMYHSSLTPLLVHTSEDSKPFDHEAFFFDWSLETLFATPCVLLIRL